MLNSNSVWLKPADSYDDVDTQPSGIVSSPPDGNDYKHQHKDHTMRRAILQQTLDLLLALSMGASYGQES